MSKFRGRLIEWSFFILTAVFFCGLSVHAAQGCAHNYIAVGSYEPTCASEGGTIYKCTECSHTYIGDKIDKLPHTWETVDENDPTCTASGSLTRRCKVCGSEETTANGDALGHNFSDNIVKDPTCSEQGYTFRICETCNHEEILPDSYTETVDHTYETEVITEPTCQQEGYAEYTCSVCSHSYREPIPMVEHKLKATVTAPTHTEQGYTTYICEFCGMTKRDDFTEPIPYDMEYALTEPTCTVDGLKVGICRDGCQHSESEVLPAVGHRFGEGEDEGWHTVRAATETLDGLEQRTCTVCGLVESRSTPFVASSDPPPQKLSPALLICIIFALVLFLGVMVFVLLFILERTGRKNHKKYALLTAVDKAIEEEKLNR